MKNRVLVPIGVALVGLAAWLLLRGGEPGPGPSPDDELAVRPGAETRELATSATEVAPPAVAKPLENPRPRPPVKDITDRGSLLVVPVAPEGGTVPKELHLDLEALGPAPAAQPLPLPLDGDQYRYESIPVGTYRVRISADFLMDSIGEAVVKADQETRVDVALLAGGMATYTAVLISGDPVERVTLAVLDGRGLPVPARFLSRKRSEETSARVDVSAVLPSEGIVSSLKPGHYTLRATSPKGASDDQVIDVKAGESVAVAFRIVK